jgi:hypothetical protein
MGWFEVDGVAVAALDGAVISTNVVVNVAAGVVPTVVATVATIGVALEVNVGDGAASGVAVPALLPRSGCPQALRARLNATMIL